MFGKISENPELVDNPLKFHYFNYLKEKGNYGEFNRKIFREIKHLYPTYFEKNGKILPYLFAENGEPKKLIVQLMHWWRYSIPTPPIKNIDSNLAKFYNYNPIRIASNIARSLRFTRNWNFLYIMDIYGGWHLGTDGNNFMEGMVDELIKEKMRETKITNKELYFYGRCSGAYAGLYHGMKLGAKELYLTQPQVDLPKIYPKDGFRIKHIFGNNTELFKKANLMNYVKEHHRKGRTMPMIHLRGLRYDELCSVEGYQEFIDFLREKNIPFTLKILDVGQHMKVRFPIQGAIRRFEKQ